jgi:type IV pilus biogenesis protein CpaD/CtpE
MRILIPLVVLVTACSSDYPMDKPGTWSLDSWGSSNDANLRAMVVNPHDLVEGRGEPNTLGAEAAPPVKRLFTGKRYALPASDVIQLNVTGPNDQNQNNGASNDAQQ